MRWRRRLLRRQRRVEHERRVQLVATSIIRFVDGGWRLFAEGVARTLEPVARFGGFSAQPPALPEPDRAAAELAARKYLSTADGQRRFGRKWRGGRTEVNREAREKGVTRG